jgi:hypothetical protein
MKIFASSGSPAFTRRLLLLLVVGLAVLPAHFFHLRSLGVYEDDYWAIVPFLGANSSTLLATAKLHFSVWMTGRPLNYVLPAVISAVGSRLAGLDGIYLITGLALLLNCLLVYWIARKFVSAPSAMFGALFYGLYPADTTKILLVHGSHVQTSVTFALIAFALFLSAKPVRWLCYPVASLSLLSYESAYLPFILAPILLFTATRAWIKRGGLHLLLCLGTMAIIAGIRLSKGDSRAASVAGNLSEALVRSFTSLFIGPKTSGVQAIAGPLESLPRVDLNGWLVAFVAALGLLVIWLMREDDHPVMHPDKLSPAIARRPFVQLALSGLIFWAASYALTLVDPHYPPVRTFGRLTSVHVAGGFGAALFCVGMIEWARWIIPKRLIFPFAFILSGYVGLLASHSYAVQRGYIYAWVEEQRFWGQVLKLAPDITAHTAILVTGPQASQGLTIASNSWSDALILQYFFQLPPGSEPPVLVMLENSGALNAIHASGAEIRWKPFYWSGVETNLDPTNVIVLHSDYGRLSRIEKVLVPGINTYLYSKPIGPATEWPRSLFYHEMFERMPGKL